MRIGPFTITRTKALPPLQPLSGRGGWWSVIREPFMGAWQRNMEVRAETALTYFAVYACLRLISTDIGKLSLRLVEQDSEGNWFETTSPAFSPLLRKPNRFQTINKFIEQWILSKLIHGNTYVLLERDNRNVVRAMYVLDPTRVTPLVSMDGAVYYQLKRDDLSGLRLEMDTVPASEIIHDTMITLYHPLIGVSPLYASGATAVEGLAIQTNSKTFFDNMSQPSGILTAPVGISPEQALKLQETWKSRAPGDIAVLAGDLKYQALTLSAHDAQLIEQLKWTAETVCSTFGVPPYLVDIGDPPPYANFEPLLLKYHSQCIQSLTTNFERCFEDKVGLAEKIEGRQLGVEFDIDDLIWMDTETRVASAKEAIGSGGMSPNEARKRYFGLSSVAGGQTPYMQNQMWPLKQLAERETPAAPALPAMPTVERGDGTDEDEEMAMAASFASALNRKAIEAGLFHAA